MLIAAADACYCKRVHLLLVSLIAVNALDSHCRSTIPSNGVTSDLMPSVGVYDVDLERMVGDIKL